MLGKMMDQPLLISSLIEHAGRCHGRTEIISVETSGEVEVTTWAQVGANARRLGSALTKLGLPSETRSGTIAWNNRRHLEIYFGSSGGGFFCPPRNPRLHPAQMVYIANDAEDRVMFFDRTFLPIVAKLKDRLETVEHFVLLGAHDAEAAAMLDGLQFYDDLIADGVPALSGPIGTTASHPRFAIHPARQAIPRGCCIHTVQPCCILLWATSPTGLRSRRAIR
jgi:fatty-acyl-CoA synthase